VAAIACRNIVFGVAAAWAIAKFDFPRQEPAHHADRPAVLGLAGDRGLIYRAAVRRRGGSGACADDGSRSSSAVPGIVLATIFVTFPFVAASSSRSCRKQGRERRGRRSSLGASGWQTFFRVTLPQREVGALLRRVVVQRPRDGRVRRGFGGFRGISRGPDRDECPCKWRSPLQ
jgi:sulfate transport system permease protein